MQSLIFRAEDKASFDQIKDGLKKIETRAGLDEYFKIQENDKLLFVCGEQSFTKTVNKVRRFRNLDQLFEVYNPAQINPEIQSKQEMVNKYLSYPGYPERIEKLGIIAFELI